MKSPLVCCVMLTQPGREAMAARAARCMDAQTYQRLVSCVSMDEKRGLSIGALRNKAIREAVELYSPDVLVTFDDDDWSHPKRVEEQVALLESTGADCVGYSDMLFYRAPEAWYYRAPDYPLNYSPGAALAFRRSFWERGLYRDVSDKEDYYFIEGRSVRCVPSVVPDGPRLIATIHGDNTMAQHYAHALSRPSSFERSPQWDEYCRKSLLAQEEVPA